MTLRRRKALALESSMSGAAAARPESPGLFEFAGYDVGVRLRRVIPEFYKETRVLLTVAGQDLLREASSRAAMFSTRIPQALFLRVQMGEKASVSLRASLKVAPHARVMEGFTRDPFRHPVYGNREVWRDQEAHPYLTPTTQREGERFVQDVKAILADVFERGGIK